MLVGLDIGDKRVGVAVVSTEARLPRPLVTLQNDDTIYDQIAKIVQEQAAEAIVYGLPRGMDGQETEQTKRTRAFIERLHTHLEIPAHFQDEALTSKMAEAELEASGKPYARGDIDALAASYILTDYLIDHDHEYGVMH
jgi:putative Holliday junction resolvase